MFNLPKPQEINWNRSFAQGASDRQAYDHRKENQEMARAKYKMQLAQQRSAEQARLERQKRQAASNDMLAKGLEGGAIDGLNDFQRQYLMQNPDFAHKVMQDRIKGSGGPMGGLMGFEDKKQMLDAHSGFRKEFTKVSDDFIKVRDAQARIEASAQDPSAAGDLALIFNYMKVLDPGSTVREGEFATAQNSAGIPDRLRAMYNNIVNGNRLAETQRSDFVTRSRMLYGRQEQQYKKTRKIYEDIARRNGLDVESALPDWGMAAERQRNNAENSRPVRKRAQDSNGNIIELNPETNQWEPVR